MVWRYVIISNFKTEDRSFAPVNIIKQFDDVVSVDSGIAQESFEACIEDFVARRQQVGWGTINISHKLDETIVLDEASTQDAEQLALEFGDQFSIAKVSQMHLDLFLYFERGGTIEALRLDPNHEHLKEYMKHQSSRKGGIPGEYVKAL